MSETKQWPAHVHRYLDGEAVPVEEGWRQEADQYRSLLAAYAQGLPLPGADVERAVMARLGRGVEAHPNALWRWFLRPRQLRASPLLAAAALAVVAGLSAAVTSLVVRAGRPEAAAAGRTGTVLVRFELVAPEAGRVALAGSFNGWSDSTLFFHRNSASGTWSITVPLKPGEYEYLFVLDGERWIPDPGAHAQVDDGLGNVNSMIVVGPRGVVRT
jgi:hypothetical protein